MEGPGVNENVDIAVLSAEDALSTLVLISYFLSIDERVCVLQPKVLETIAYPIASVCLSVCNVSPLFSTKKHPETRLTAHRSHCIFLLCP